MCQNVDVNGLISLLQLGFKISLAPDPPVLCRGDLNLFFFLKVHSGSASDKLINVSYLFHIVCISQLTYGNRRHVT